MEILGKPLPALASQVVLGLVNGSFYAILSLGLAVIFGTLNIVNFAHGAFYMLGAFGAFFALTALGVNYWWALLLVPLGVGVIGVLVERGLLRWYAKCCNTPIGNTLPDHRQAFVGIIHSCLGHDRQAIERGFGPVTARLNTAAARGASVKMHGLFSTLVRIGAIILRGRIDGSYRQTPFFVAEVGTPVAIPKILPSQQREHLMKAIRA